MAARGQRRRPALSARAARPRDERAKAARARSSGSVATCATSITPRSTTRSPGRATVYCAFVFDREILDALPVAADRRVEFIWDSVRELDAALRARGGGLDRAPRARARRRFPRSPRRSASSACTRTTTTSPPRATATRPSRTRSPTAASRFRTCKDQVIFERDEVLDAAGTPFRVFTPYQERLARAHSTPARRRAVPDRRHTPQRSRVPPAQVDTSALPTLAATGLRAHEPRGAAACTPGMRGGAARFADFRDTDRSPTARRATYPAVKGPSYLSVHLRFGTVSIRELVAYRARALAAAGRRGRGRVAVGARLARVLRADPLAPPARRRPRVQAGIRRARLSERSGATRRVARGAHRLPDRRRGDAPARTRPATCTTGCG